MKTNLCPAQQKAFEMLKHESSFGSVLVLFGNTGLGKSTVLRAAHSEFGGAFLNMSDFMNAVRDCHPLSLEEVFSEMMMAALKDNDTVIIDDFHLLNNVVCCNHFYPRLNFLNAPLTALTTHSGRQGSLCLR